MSPVTPPTNPEPATTLTLQSRTLLMAGLTFRSGRRLADAPELLFAIEAAARAQALAPERLTAAIMAAVGASHPDDFGIAYRQRGFSPAGLAAAVLALLPPSAEDRHG